MPLVIRHISAGSFYLETQSTESCRRVCSKSSFPQTQLKRLLNKKISVFTHWDHTRSPHLEEWVIGKVWGSDLLYMFLVKPSSTTGLIILSSVWDWFWGPVGGACVSRREGARKQKKRQRNKSRDGEDGRRREDWEEYWSPDSWGY